MRENISKIIFMFIIGMAGGIFASQIFWPYFIQRPILNIQPAPVIEKTEITITENTAFQNLVEKFEKTVVGVRTRINTGEILQGSGLIITSDGLMVTLAELVPKGETFAFFIDGKAPAYQILKRDFKNNLALVKIEEINLSTAGFADFRDIKLGERVFLISAVLESSGLKKIVNQGIVRSFDENYIQTNIIEKSIIKGSPLFDIKGNILGLNTIDLQGNVSAVPVAKIREFVGF